MCCDRTGRGLHSPRARVTMREMSEQHPDDRGVRRGEVVDGLPVLAEVRAVSAPSRRRRPGRPGGRAGGGRVLRRRGRDGRWSKRLAARQLAEAANSVARAADPGRVAGRDDADLPGQRPPDRSARRVTSGGWRSAPRSGRRWCYRLPRFGGLDGLMRMRGGVLHRLLHRGEASVHVRVAQLARDRVLFGARAERSRGGGVGDRADARRARRRPGPAAVPRALSLRPADRRARSVRDPGLRVLGRPEPFEALAWAICEQLIESERAAAIERRLIARLGRRCPRPACATPRPPR